MIESEKHRDDWRHFWQVLSYPWSIMFLILALALDVALVLIGPNDKVVVALLTSLTSLSSGIVGGILAKRWGDLSEEQMMVVRGKAAIRSLMLLFTSVQALKGRVGIYLHRHTDEEYREKLSSEVTRTYLEETILTCRVIEEEVLNSVDDWQDIIPEANVASQSRIMRERAVEQEELSKEVQRLKVELERGEEAREQSEEEKKELRAQLKKKQEELYEMRRKRLYEDPLQVGTAALSTGSGLSISPGNDRISGVWTPDNQPISSIFASVTCKKCGKLFTPDFLGSSEYCPECSTWALISPRTTTED